MNFEISKENINNILMTPKTKILIIRQHMEKKSDGNNSDISLKKEHQKIHRNCIIRMQ